MTQARLAELIGVNVCPIFRPWKTGNDLLKGHGQEAWGRFGFFVSRFFVAGLLEKLFIWVQVICITLANISTLSKLSHAKEVFLFLDKFMD